MSKETYKQCLYILAEYSDREEGFRVWGLEFRVYSLKLDGKAIMQTMKGKKNMKP